MKKKGFPKVTFKNLELDGFNYDSSFVPTQGISSELSYNLGVEFTILLTQDHIIVTVEFRLFKGPTQELMQIRCKNVYHCVDLQKQVDAKTKRFSEPKFEKYLIDKSFGHTRAVHAMKVKGISFFEDYLMPLATPPTNYTTEDESKRLNPA